MGSFSIWHWLIVLVVVAFVFGGRAKLSGIMGDAAKAQVEQVFKEIGDSLQGSDIQLHPPMSYQYDTPAEPEPVAPAPEPAPVVEAPKKPRVRKAAAPKAEAGVKPKAAAKPKASKPKAGAKA